MRFGHTILSIKSIKDVSIKDVAHKDVAQIVSFEKAFGVADLLLAVG